MPRQARLDVPDVLYHVFARAIPQKNLFYCDDDYNDFFCRLKNLFLENHIRCYAWSLIPDRFYLLIRPEQALLKKTMRRLLTGYTSAFKKRHKSDGKIFHGRYHSIICQDKPYFEPLVCDIHLQPLKNEIFQTLESLIEYPWTGHQSMMGINCQQLDENGVQETLNYFSQNLSEARNLYVQALRTSLNDQKNINFEGGGWMRSTESSRKDVWHTTDDEMSLYDSRILGTPEFVKKILEKADSLNNQKPETYISIHELIDKVSKYYQISAENLFQKNQQKSVSLARSVICHIEINHLGRSGSVVGKMMKIKSYSALRCAQRGHAIYEADAELKKLIGI
ncbi:hypothetical protein MHK_002076 [Candidatus Magnetomorum sp. HK-1]|nr:hypothetical protein MHK_002076 [Candidatus Magnetomorum sp. HK-1]